MKNLLKAYEILSTVFMFGFLTLMLIAMTDNTYCTTSYRQLNKQLTL